MSAEEKNLKEKTDEKLETAQISPNCESVEKLICVNLMKNEKERLASFKDWPLNFILPQELAKYGFYYLGRKDMVKCAFCKIVMFEWREGESPFHEHYKHYPICPFLSGFEVGNVPIDKNPIKLADQEKGIDVCGHFTFVNENDPNRSIKTNNSNQTLQNVASCCSRGPKNIDFVTLDSRLRSFEKNWPKECPVKPEKLAEAGFFYIEVEDFVKCFYCDGGLCDWQKEDEPWTEHEKWFPCCDFIRLMKTETSSESVLNPPKVVKTESIQENEIKTQKNETKKFEESKDNKLNENILEVNKETDKESTLSFEGVNASVNSHSDDDSAIASGTSSPHEVSPSSSPVLNSKPLDSVGLICKICLDLDVNVVFIPCMHAISCVQCALGLTNCPICRNAIHERKRLYFS